MKLLVNGCSFTGGNDVVHDEEGVLASYPIMFGLIIQV